MTPGLVSWVEGIATVGCGLAAGLFVAFSAGIMTALGRLPPDRGAAAMQAINVAVLNPVFLAVFLGAALACVALLITVATGGGVWSAIGAGLYVVGAFGVTVAVNVPMNNALAADGVAVWERYLVRWTRWNHVRTVASTAAVVVLAVT